MNEKDTRLNEQDHPLKNTDNAFVQVGAHGEPVMPHTAAEKEEQDTEDKRSTTPEKR